MGRTPAQSGDERLCGGQQRIHVKGEKRSDGWDSFSEGAHLPAGTSYTQRTREDIAGLEPGLKPDGCYGGVGGGDTSVRLEQGNSGRNARHSEAGQISYVKVRPRSLQAVSGGSKDL